MGLLSKTATGWSFFVISVALVCWLSAFPMLATAQGGQGQNAVYPTSGTCCVGSKAFIDASMFGTNSTDICADIYNFAGAPGGAYVSGALVFGKSGNRCSTTEQGGSGTCPGGCGTVFEVWQ